MVRPIHRWIERMRAAHERADREEFATASELDVARVRALMVEAMGVDDERVRAWDDIVRRFAPH